MKTILRSINNFSCKLKQSNNLKYNISPKIRSNKFKNISGNGDIVIEDALGKDLKDYKIYGNTYQNSTSGKNLLDISKIEKTTKNGVTCSYDPETQVVTLNGTCTVNNTAFTITPKPNIPIKTSTTKLYAYCINGSVENYGIFRMYDTDWAKNININLLDFDVNHKIVKKTAGSTFSAVNIGVRLNDGAVCNNFQFKVMVADSDDDTYEPYTNGPTPNPTFEEKIISCGDRTKNLFLTLDTPASAYRATYSKINKNSLSLNYNQENSSNSSSYVRIDFDISQFKPNTQYTISKKHIVSGNNFSNAGAIRSYINGSNGSVNNVNSFTFTTPNEITSLGVYFYLGYNNTIQGESTITFYDIQIEENSTATSYEPYGYKIPVNVRSENLCNITSLTGYQYNSQIPTTPNNNFVINNFDSNNLSYSITSNGYVLGLLNVIKLEPNTIYTMSCIRNSTENSPRIYIYNYVNNTYTLNSRILGRGNLTFDFTTDETGNIVLGFAVGNNSNGASGTISNIQIVEGSTAPSKYIPYYNETTNIYLDEPLRKTKDGTYVDYIDFANQKVYRQLGKTEISDYSSFSVNAITARFIQYLTPAIENLKLKIRDGISFEESYFFCNYIRMFGGSTTTSKIRINILHEYLGTTPSSTAQEAKSALINLMNGKTMIFTYPLETPTEEDIELPNINLIEGENIITIGTEVFGVFKVEYYSKEIIDISDYKYNLRKVED